MVLVKLATDISLPLPPALVSMLSLAALKPNSTKCSNWSKEEASHTGVKMSKGPADTSKCLNLIMLAAVSQDLDTNCRLSSFPSLPCIKSIRCPIFQVAFQLTLKADSHCRSSFLWHGNGKVFSSCETCKFEQSVFCFSSKLVKVLFCLQTYFCFVWQICNLCEPHCEDKYLYLLQ